MTLRGRRRLRQAVWLARDAADIAMALLALVVIYIAVSHW